MNNSNWNNYQSASVIQVWQPSEIHYSSPFNYRCDPLILNPQNLKTVELWNAKKNEIEYSSERKAYYSNAPSNYLDFHSAPITGEFNFTRLPQTNVLDLIYWQNHSVNKLGTTSLAHTISPLIDKMGTMINSSGENLGTCTLIAHNLVLVARHAIEGQNIQNIHVKFGYSEYKGSFYNSGQTGFDRVYAACAACDYAIIQLQEPIGERLGFFRLNVEPQACTDPALLHYPLGKSLKVSVNALEQTQHQADRLLTYHDSDYLSSGGVYFDTDERMIAMHLGTEMHIESMNVRRYALPLEAIVRNNKNSLLGKFARGELSQDRSYTIKDKCIYLPPANHKYLISEEGRESEKILKSLIKPDKKIQYNRNKTINFSKDNLDHIAKTQKKVFDDFQEECLGVGGLYGASRHYSVTGFVASDHTIPHQVWKTTSNKIMKKIVKQGGGNRLGENRMPAITIPWDIHEDLLTTGNSKESVKFRNSLRILCDQYKVHKALIKCYEDYDDKGLNMQAYKRDIKHSLDDYVTLGLITPRQKNKVVNAIY